MRGAISIHAPRTGSDGTLMFCEVETSNFNPRSPHGERPPPASCSPPSGLFQSTLPARGATARATGPSSGGLFQSTLPARGATLLCFTRCILSSFQSTLPARGATTSVFTGDDIKQFQSTLPARGATRTGGQAAGAADISIHAPRTGSDGLTLRGNRAEAYFNPRSPHGERRPRPWQSCRSRYFNPRSPHGERLVQFFPVTHTKHFNPRSPHGERPSRQQRMLVNAHFNPRSPHGERQTMDMLPFVCGSFQSTLPARGATAISAPVIVPANFNPRSPHGERPPCTSLQSRRRPISIHAPRTGSDYSPPRKWRAKYISIHAPRTGSDGEQYATTSYVDEFQSTLPARGATNTPEERKRVQDAFQSTLPARGATRQFDEDFQNAANFNPRSPHGERPMPQLPGHRLKIFQSTLPARGATVRAG